MKSLLYRFIVCFLFLELIVLTSNSQTTPEWNPNRGASSTHTVWVKQDEKKVPKGVCIPAGYIISEIFEPTDMNKDSLPDFIFKWRKSNLTDGDTLFVTIYIQNRDSSFSNFRTFKNLFPIYFERYDFDYIPKDEKLKTLHKKYLGNYQFLNISFQKGNIEISTKGDATSDLITTYTYDAGIKNWRYQKTIMYDFIANTKENFDSSEELGPTIDQFRYFTTD